MTSITATSRSLDRPDEQVDNGSVHVDIIHLGGMNVKRQSFPPGWRFSVDTGQERCYDTHVGYMVSGHVHVQLDGGGDLEIRGGDIFVIPPGHDAWTVGDESATMVQFDEGASALSRFGVDAGTSRAARPPRATPYAVTAGASASAVTHQAKQVIRYERVPRW